MVLSDQQLRQELINLGEVVPPVTQRNREQLRARLELLQSLKSVRGSANSPSKARSRGAASPSKLNTTSSPSRTRATGSPSKSHATSSPSRARAAASPARSNLANSPSRTRANAGGSGRTTRSKQTPNLIELSDSEAESASVGALTSRSVRAGQTAPHTQKRSIPVRGRNNSPTKSNTSPGVMTDDVEQSIARHRREIKQLLDSARDRNRTTNSGSPSRSGQQSSPSKPRSRRSSSQSESDETSSKLSSKARKEFSKLKKVGKPIEKFGKKLGKFIKNLLKLLLIGALALAGLYVYQNRDEFFSPQYEEITCSVANATKCEDMRPVIAAVRKQLQVRTGEVDCGFRPKADILVNRTEVERYLNERGLKFRAGDNVRWNALLTYIIDTPIQDIILWDAANQQTKVIPQVQKLGTTEAVRSLACRARQDVSSNTLRNIALLILGSTGLLTLARYLHKSSKDHDENEQTFKDYYERAKDLLQESYEKYIENPKHQSSLVIDHIRDKLIPEKDQQRLAHVWDRIKKEIGKQDTRLRSELQEIDGKRLDVWRWIKSAASSSPKKGSKAQTSNDDDAPSEVGLTECLKVRNCFRSDNSADDEEIDEVVDSLQARCVDIKRIEHIGIHSVFVYLKFSSKEAAARGYHLLNNWKFEGQNLNVKYIRLNRYYEHFPEAKDASVED